MNERENNAVFQASQATQSAPKQSIASQVRQDFGFELPQELAPLPSNGLVYPADHPFHGQQHVGILAMTAQHEDILSNRALHKRGTVVTELLRASLSDKNVDPRSLLSGDRNALMTTIRASGYGAEYPVEYTCPECAAQSPHTFDLSRLGIKRLAIEPTALGLNEFEFKLPKLGKTVKFKFLTGADEEDITATAEKQKKLGFKTENNITQGLLYTLVSVDGIVDRAKLAAFVRNMPAMDSSALRRYIRTNEPGIDMTQEVVCPSCGHEENEVDIAITAEFFWPGSLS